MPSFLKAISGKDRIKVIAEVKRRSPSFGDFPNHDVSTLLLAYEKGGASAISVVTEPTLFKGSLELLREVRRATQLPVLRKDFITRPEQVEETARCGADAILLITRLLTKPALTELVTLCAQFKIDPVLEINDDEDLEKITGMHGIIVGINNRDLRTFETDVKHAAGLLHRIDPSLTIIAESAFSNAKELIPYRGKIDAVLIGTALLTSKDPQVTLSNFTAVN